MPTDVRTEARLTLEYLMGAERYLREHDKPVEASAVRAAIDRFMRDHASLLGMPAEPAPPTREPADAAVYLFRTLRDAIDSASADADPAKAIAVADRLLKLETAINSPEQRLLSYRSSGGPDVVTFIYQLYKGSPSPVPGEDGEHSLLAVLRVGGQERDRHHRLFRGAT